MVKSRKNLKGGNGPLTPGEYKGVGTIAVGGDANYAKMPNMFSSNLVGGRRRRGHSKRCKSKCSHSKRKQRGGMGYGFANPNAASYAAGSYFPITPTCSSALDVSRGGNNFMSGGAMILGGAPLIGGRKRKGGSMILVGGRRSKKHRKSKKNKTQKWWQVGCKKLAGGFASF
jgi:hypothetical protein